MSLPSWSFMESLSLRKPWTVILSLCLLWPPLLFLVGTAVIRSIQDFCQPSNLSENLGQLAFSDVTTVVTCTIFGALLLSACKLHAGKNWARDLLTTIFVLNMIFFLIFLFRFFCWVIFSHKIEPFCVLLFICYLYPSCIIGLLYCKRSNLWFDAMANVPKSQPD